MHLYIKVILLICSAAWFTKVEKPNDKIDAPFFNRLRVGMIYNIEVSLGGEGGGAEHRQERAT